MSQKEYDKYSMHVLIFGKNTHVLIFNKLEPCNICLDATKKKKNAFHIVRKILYVIHGAVLTHVIKVFTFYGDHSPC